MSEITINQIFPSIEELITISNQGVGLLLLQFLEDKDINIHNLLVGSNPEFIEYSKSFQKEFYQLISEGISWLESEQLIVREPFHSGHLINYMISRKGRELLKERDFTGYVSSEVIQPKYLHSTIQHVVADFIKKDYESAIFKAFKEVEVRVRKLGDFSNKDIGVKLMTMAFKPSSGKLIDDSLEESEQEAMMQLFRSSIGLFKNPASHRTLDYTDPIQVAGIIKQADNLHRILDEIENRSIK